MLHFASLPKQPAAGAVHFEEKPYQALSTIKLMMHCALSLGNVQPIAQNVQIKASPAELSA
jgi:hypothetical protein